MSVSVDIADRHYDYADEEKAAEAIAVFQSETGLSDRDILSIWEGCGDARREELERRIFRAVGSKGSPGSARKNVPADISLYVEYVDVRGE